LSIRILPFSLRMSVSRKLATGAVITVFLSLLVSATLYISAREIDKASKTTSFADQVVKDVSNLNSLSYAYLLLKSERPRIQWQLKHDSLRKLLSEHIAAMSEEQALLERLRQNHGRMQELFNAVSARASLGKKASRRELSLYDELNESVTAQLITRAEMMVNDASLLARSADRRVEALRRNSFILVLSSALVLAVSSVLIAAFLAKNIGGSMRGLDRGAREIASGNLEYRVKVSGEDEIALVGASFNDMAARLKTSYSQLEREVAERRLAEGALAELNKTLEQRVAERTAELAESEEKFRSAFASASIGFSMATPEGRFVDANEAYCRIIGYGVDELRAMGLFQVIHPDDREENLRQIDRMLGGATGSFVIENRYVPKNGSPVWVRKSVSLVRDVNGSPQWIISLIEDISVRKLAEERVERYMEDLKRANEELTRFNRLMVGRELRMVELKREINALSSRTGLPEPYKTEGGEGEREGQDEA